MPSLHILSDYDSKYFLTLTVIEWINIFTGVEYFQLLADSLNYCIYRKKLVINGYVFMTNHVHLIVDKKEGGELGGVIRDFKRHTTKEVIGLVKHDNRSYIRRLLYKTYKKRKKNSLQVWEPNNWPLMVEDPEVYNIKLDYIHNNPIKKGYVDEPCDWVYSSARDYYTKERSPVRVTVE
ncbi:transposase [Candidatus Dojkabacteria bacterium]|nr:transposase [Candidatus Dojkabacteria bacterium]